MDLKQKLEAIHDELNEAKKLAEEHCEWRVRDEIAHAMNQVAITITNTRQWHIEMAESFFDPT